jgi:hypothetical protein
MTKLDRTRKFGVVVGSHNGSAFYQDGLHFRGDGSCIEESDIPEPVAEAAPIVTTAVPVADPAADPGVTREQLQALHPTKIKKLVGMAGIELETGQGSKARNIENLLAAG